MNEEYENGTQRDINGMATTAQVFAAERTLYAASQAAPPLTADLPTIACADHRPSRGKREQRVPCVKHNQETRSVQT